MPSPLDKIKPQVRGIDAYSLAALKAPIKVNQNENPYDVPAEIKAEVLRRLDRRPWSRYPAFVPVELPKNSPHMSAGRLTASLRETAPTS